MKTITKEFTIYEYLDILSNEDLKQKILQKYYDINTDFNWFEDTLEDWKTKLEAIGFINPEINFTGFNSQGDGASFTCEYIDIKKIAIHSELFTNREINALYALWNNGYIEAAIKRSTYHYYHKYTITNEFYDGQMLIRWTHLQKIVDRLREYIDNLILTLSDAIYKQLETEYEYLTSEEAILETIQANNYEFYEDGSIAA